MTGSEPMRASRVRKARGESCCGLCGSPVLVGNWVGFIEQRWWCHVRCIIERNAVIASARESASLPKEEQEEAT